jgi:hypothetical protein
VLSKGAVSLLCGGAAYALWLAAFLLVGQPDSLLGRGILWPLAPVVTAVGFAAGSAIVERLAGTGRTAFVRLYLWPLAGCVLGALVVYWFGPMLIVFGMLALGAASVLARELVAGMPKAESAGSATHVLEDEP